MKALITLSIFLLSFSIFAQDLDLPCNPQDGLPPELEFLMEGVAPVVSEVNECADKHGIKKEHLRTANKVDDESLSTSITKYMKTCFLAFLQGLKESGQDLLKLAYDVLIAAGKAINATFWETYDFAKAVMTGNISYWYAEASRDANNFLNKFVKAFQAIPTAIGEFFKDKAEDWECRNAEGKTEMACRIAGYLGGDTLAGFFTFGFNKVALTKKLKKISDKVIPKRSNAKAPKKKTTELGKAKGKLLDDLIPANKKNSRFVVEVDQKGHFSVRYFDKDGIAKQFDGSPFYHLINKRHRRAGVGTHRVRNFKHTNEGEHFTIDVDPEKFQKLLTYIDEKKGKISVACTRTACESMKTVGIDLGQKPVPSIDKLYKGLLDESSKSSGVVSRVENGLTPLQQDALIQQYKTGTNLVKMQFGMTSFVGYFVPGVVVGTPMNLMIDRMDSHVPQN